MAETGTVENDDPVVLGSKIDQSAGFEILNHAAVTVQKHERIPCTTLNVVKPNAVHLKEATSGRIVSLRLSRKMTIDKRRHSQCSNRYRRS